MREGTAPQKITSKCRIKYVKSSWRIHQFEICGGEMICSAATLRMKDSAMVWVGDTLGSLALGMPGSERGAALCSALLGGEDGAAPALARRLAATLRHPVYVACGAHFDRFTLPLVERALVNEIKKYPECF